MRSLPAPPHAELRLERKAVDQIEVEVCLITRLFGGGARKGEIDRRSWLRPPAFKSALRFWWRAGHAHLFESLAELRRQEDRIFGSAARFERDAEGQRVIRGGPGLVEVEVDALGNDHESDQPWIAKQLVAYSKESVPLNLAYFAAQEQTGRDGAAKRPARKLLAPGFRTDARLKMRLLGASPDDRSQVLDALRLWLALGGVGARTRRGAGAIAPNDLATAKKLENPRSRSELGHWLRRWFRPPHGSGASFGVWSLAACQAALIGPEFSSATEAQSVALEVLANFRQDRIQGKSLWPESDAVRLHAGMGGREKNRGRYPRSSLGLPIVLKFKDDVLKFKDDVVPAHTISAAKPNADSTTWTRVNRFASPILIRPVQIGWDYPQVFVPVVLIGPMTLPDDFRPLVERQDFLDTSREPSIEDVSLEYSFKEPATKVLEGLAKDYVSALGFERII